MTDLSISSILTESLTDIQQQGLEKVFGATGILLPVQIESYKRYRDLLFTSSQVQWYFVGTGLFIVTWCRNYF